MTLANLGFRRMGSSDTPAANHVGHWCYVHELQTATELAHQETNPVLPDVVLSLAEQYLPWLGQEAQMWPGARGFLLHQLGPKA